MLLISDPGALPEHRRVWGSGASLPPDEREALDWLTLGRLLGWSVTIAHPSAASLRCRLPEAGGVIVGCDPDRLDEETAQLLAAVAVARPLLILARVGAPGSPVARLAQTARASSTAVGTEVQWLGPGLPCAWTLRVPVSTLALERAANAEVWATLGGRPFVVSRRLGQSWLVTLGCHPSVWRDADHGAAALFAHLLTLGSPLSSAWLDLKGSLVLRMDDPGGAQNVYFKKWTYRKLHEHEWAEVAAHLGRYRARLTIGYTPGWVDDGDPERGVLEIDGVAAARAPGRVHPAPRITYSDRAGHAPGTMHDYVSEYRGIEAVRAGGLGEVEVHGYTHMYPDGEVWAKAPDRYETKAWFRELGTHAAPAIHARPAHQHPVSLATAAIRQYFGVQPTTLICPGHECVDLLIARALDEELHLVSQAHLALRYAGHLCWTTHIAAPYLDEVDAYSFASGLPVIGFFHDRDLVLEGTDWLGRCLDEWLAAGAVRFIDFRQLAAELGSQIRIEGQGSAMRVVINSEGAPALERPMPILIRLPAGPLPTCIPVIRNGIETDAPVENLGAGLGRIIVPPKPTAAAAP